MQIIGYIHDLTEATTMLTKSVRVLQGSSWEGNPEQARQYLISMDMDLAFASGLVSDMEADNFAQAIRNLTEGKNTVTGYKSIAIWVRKFGFDANLLASGDKWAITPHHELGHGEASCGTCKFCEDGICNCLESVNYLSARDSNSLACENYKHRHMNRWGCAAIIAIIVAILGFFGVWIFTGNIWAAIYIFEVLFDIILELTEIFN